METICEAVGLSPDDLEVQKHFPRVASVGLPFLMVDLTFREALQKARTKLESSQVLRDQGVPYIHLYMCSHDEYDIRARMFAPFEGVFEDPATGSANCALAGLLADLMEAEQGHFSWKIAQGVEMGRPSILHARAKKIEGQVVKTWIGGNCVQMGEGTLQVP